MPPRIESHLGAPDYPVLHAFMGCRASRSCIRGPLGSGKTIASAQRLLAQISEQAPNAQGERRSRWLVVRNTYLDLTQTTIKDFLVVFDGMGRMHQGGGEPPNFQARFALSRNGVPDGTVVVADIIFLALDRADAVRKLKGYQVHGIWFNELSEIAKPLVDMADLRLGRFSELQGGAAATWFGWFGDTNSFDDDHWLAVMMRDPSSDCAFFHQPGGVLATPERDPLGRRVWLPNPAAENLRNLPPGYYERGLQGKSDDWIAIYLANEFGFAVNGKPVHPEYVDSVHGTPVELEPDRRYPLIVGIDFGRTPAAAITQYLEHAGRWHVLDELCSQDMSAAVFAPQLKRYLDRHYSGFPVRGFGDPAGDQSGQQVEDTPIQIVRAAGIPCVAAPSNIASLRRAAIANPALRMCMDGRPALRVSPRARMIRKGLMGGFCYRRLKLSGEERYTDEPDKNAYSHPVEACEYALLGGGEGRAALQPPPHVRSSGGPRQTTAVMD